jgi:acyl-CoA synthetase (AMP-forming)/AMP-acid ligase II
MCNYYWRAVQHLYNVVRQRAQRWPTATALGAQDGLGWRMLDSRALLAKVDGLAEQLTERGVRGGDRVVLWLPSGLATPVYLFALWKLGAIAVPFDRDMNPQAAAAIIRSVEPRLVILGNGQQPTWGRKMRSSRGNRSRARRRCSDGSRPPRSWRLSSSRRAPQASPRVA